MDSLLGTTLLSKNGSVNTTDALAGKKAVALYFSAHWCPPCRGFTPQLAEWYTANLQAKGLEVVFVSSDKDEEAFNSYYAEQPWLALPYSERDAKAALNKQFKVRGIPSLVIVDAVSGELITTDGRSEVSQDPTGEKLPWTPPTKEEKRQMCIQELGDTFVNSSGEEFTREQKLAAKEYIGLYFSAHWCPPCRGFTPELAKIYSEGLSDKMEIVFVSSDKDEAAFKEYLGEMPWLALPYAKRSAKEALSKAFGVQGIPCFVVLDRDFNVITTEGRAMVGKDPKGDTLPDGWLPQPWADCNDDPSALNESTCVIALGGSADAIKEIADEYHNAANKDVDAMKYRFYTAPAGNIEAQLRTLTGVEGNKLIILDIPDGGAFYDAGEDMSAKGIKSAIMNFEAKNLTKSQLNN